jgi:hypothetical protein
MWSLWTAMGFQPPVKMESTRAPYMPPQRMADQLDPAELGELLSHGAISLAMLLFLVIFMIIMRRLLFRRRGKRVKLNLLPGQVARMEYRTRPPKPPPRRLEGLRALIVELWGNWERRLGAEGLGRRPGETAREYALRLKAERPDPAVTDMLESAHYGRGEPTEEDVDRMRRLLAVEFARLNPRPKKK